MAELIAAFLDGMKAAGYMPENCRHLILDVEVGKAPRLYYECYGDRRTVEVLNQVDFRIFDRDAG